MPSQQDIYDDLQAQETSNLNQLLTSPVAKRSLNQTMDRQQRFKLVTNLPSSIDNSILGKHID